MIRENMMFDNIWKEDHFFMGECAERVVFLIPHSFDEDGKSMALHIVMKRTDISYNGVCEQRCGSAEGSKLLYRINDGSEKIKFLNKLKNMNYGDTLRICLRKDNSRNTDCIDFKDSAGQKNCFTIKWRSDCQKTLRANRDCVPKAIQGKFQFKEDNHRYATGVNVMKKNPLDVF